MTILTCPTQLLSERDVSDHPIPMRKMSARIKITPKMMQGDKMAFATFVHEELQDMTKTVRRMRLEDAASKKLAALKRKKRVKSDT